jgi:hypothetical protein
MAKEHLRRFGFVGLTERFDDSLVLMKHFLGWTKLKYFTRKQTRDKPSRDAIDQRVLWLIEEHNWMDMELYRLAQELFQAQIDRIGPSVKQEFADFQVQKFKL